MTAMETESCQKVSIELESFRGEAIFPVLDQNGSTASFVEAGSKPKIMSRPGGLARPLGLFLQQKPPHI
jgi:hypothetical protein